MSIPQKTYKIIGLMSGTSLDGLDIAYCHFEKNNKTWSFSIEKTASINYTSAYKEKLKNTVNLEASKLLAFHNEYGNWLGDRVKEFIHKNNLEVDFIASHGHTVFHQPEIGLTYQIGSGQHIANTCSQKVICNFRANDVALGGQGAPLVPIGDRLLFGNYDFCLNLGGISNISFENNDKRIAYDISPVNMLLNYICKKINLEYDEGGKIAATGTINYNTLNQLNALAYYKLPYPKSLGYEWFEKNVISIIEGTEDTVQNILHTSIHHIATQIATVIKNTQKRGTQLLITGGGAKNDFLIETLRHELQSVAKIIIPSTQIIDFKEALIFAFMGVLRDLNEINCLKSVTGASKNSCSGVVYYPS
ncbi:anhydro-N-acetylmuramic acid kinase [Aquimarina gracilis]|uniref:Anhydro-N-acetylmuramic acid kinase n=1 Tax=Aquimarina gracilis TaxID=874422 RepID=A0ABU5ZYV8_9FLAO|nr:anhydro-N-acetylmuramic acid kinase [Aquimarina gracilis]MEB3347078.1 anhydro-N-acetylmuramic acid kinase [Aquimarina gracilis]